MTLASFTAAFGRELTHPDGTLILAVHAIPGYNLDGAYAWRYQYRQGRSGPPRPTLPRPIKESTMTTTAPETVAASLFVAAFKTVFQGSPSMTIALHMSNGSCLAVTGELDNYLMRFHPAEVSTLLMWLTQAAATDPGAIVTVTANYDDDGEYAHGWAWSIRTGAALDHKAAAQFFVTEVELRGAEEQHISIGGNLVDTSTDGLSATALTDDVKAVITAHGEPPQPAAGSHEIALRNEGTITIYITATDVTAAREALEEIADEDFDVDLRTPQGHLIGHVTLSDSECAELISIDGTPADELPDDETD